MIFLLDKGKSYLYKSKREAQQMLIRKGYRIFPQIDELRLN
jgi:hypothetical protein